MSKFVHLHVHSHYSLLNALPKIPDLVSFAKKNEMEALALTDNGNLYGAIEFYKECKKENIKPIIGVDFYLAIRKHTDKQAGVDNRRFRLVLLARNLTGYKNLIKLVTLGNLEGFYYRPRIDKEILKNHAEGLTCIIPTLNSDVSQAIETGDDEKAQKLIEEYRDIFGEHLYLEITHHEEIPPHEELVSKIKKFGEKEKIPLVAGQEVYYLNPEDKEARDTLLSVQNNPDLEARESNGDFSFLDKEKAGELFKNEPEALKNTLRIAESIDLELTLGSWVFPDIKLKQGENYDEELRKVVYEGL